VSDDEKDTRLPEKRVVEIAGRGGVLARPMMPKAIAPAESRALAGEVLDLRTHLLRLVDHVTYHDEWCRCDWLLDAVQASDGPSEPESG
jgi:hypothetical protein